MFQIYMNVKEGKIQTTNLPFLAHKPWACYEGADAVTDKAEAYAFLLFCAGEEVAFHLKCNTTKN